MLGEKDEIGLNDVDKVLGCLYGYVSDEKDTPEIAKAKNIFLGICNFVELSDYARVSELIAAHLTKEWNIRLSNGTEISMEMMLYNLAAYYVAVRTRSLTVQDIARFLGSSKEDPKCIVKEEHFRELQNSVTFGVRAILEKISTGLG